MMRCNAKDAQNFQYWQLNVVASYYKQFTILHQTLYNNNKLFLRINKDIKDDSDFRLSSNIDARLRD